MKAPNSKTVTSWPIGRRRWPPKVEAVIRTAAEAYSISIVEVLGPSQSRQTVKARKMAMSALRRMEYSYPEIGRMFGGRHHTSVMHAVRTYRPQRTTPGWEPGTPDYSGEWAL